MMGRPALLLLAALASALALVQAADTWSWPDGQQRPGSTASSSSSSSAVPASASRDTPVVAGRSEGRRFFGGNRPSRYEIVDPDSDDFTLPHPEDLAPNRPQSRPPFSPQRPFPGEPDYPLVSPNPGYRPPRPLGGGGLGSGLLGGNLGSGFGLGSGLGSGLGGGLGGGYGGDRQDTVSKCKCVHAFNCEGTALQFGSCDAGKRYCCSKEPRGLGQGGPRPGGYGSTAGGPIGGPGYYGGKPGILVGPGGPGSGGKGDYDRYPSGLGGGNFPGGSSGGPGLLVGPRPQYYRPDPAAGFAPSGRPGDYQGGPSGPYRDYDSYNRGNNRGDRGYGLNRS